MDTGTDFNALLAALAPGRFDPEGRFDRGRLSPVVMAGEGTRHLAHLLLSQLLLRGERVIVLDGANGFDAYALATAARRNRRAARTLLSAVRVSRAFTWQQWLALLEREAAPEAERAGARWVLALGPLDLFADANVKPFQAWRGARRTAEALRVLAASDLGVIAAQDDRVLRDGARLELMDRLKSVAGHLVAVGPYAKPPSVPMPVASERQLAFGFTE